MTGSAKSSRRIPNLSVYISIPRRFSQIARDIWSAQPRFHRTQGKQAQRLLGFPVFRAAYDFMCIQARVGLLPYDLCSWWTEYQQHNEGERAEETDRPRRPRRRRRRKRNAD